MSMKSVRGFPMNAELDNKKYFGELEHFDNSKFAQLNELSENELRRFKKGCL